MTSFAICLHKYEIPTSNCAVQHHKKLVKVVGKWEKVE